MHSVLFQSNIAVVLGEQGKFAEALEMHQKVLSVRVETLGADHPQVALTYGKYIFKLPSLLARALCLATCCV